MRPLTTKLVIAAIAIDLFLEAISYSRDGNDGGVGFASGISVNVERDDSSVFSAARDSEAGGYWDPESSFDIRMIKRILV